MKSGFVEHQRVESERCVREWKWKLWEYRGLRRAGLGRVRLCAGMWVQGYGQYLEVGGGLNLAFCSLIPAGLEAWSAKKGLTVALWISQVLLT